MSRKTTKPSATKTTEAMLCDLFAPKHVKSALEHYTQQVTEFVASEWEKSSGKGGKFIEAVLKAIWVLAGETVPGRHFGAGKIIDQLEHKKYPAVPSDRLHLTVPRACRVIYEISSNRGARHDPNEIDPNQMDATVVMATSQWILAELVCVCR